MASKKNDASNGKVLNRASSRNNFVVLFPLFIAGTFSLGYLTFHSATFKNTPPSTIGSSSQHAASDPVKQIDKVIAAEVPKLAPIEAPQVETESVKEDVIAGGSVADANKQTGAANALQNSPQTPVGSSSDKNTHLQAPTDSLKIQLRALLPR